MLLKGKIGNDQTVDADLLTGAEKPLGAVGEDHIGVGGEHQGDIHLGPQNLNEIKDLIGGNTGFQRPDVSLLDGGVHGGGVGEGNIQLDDVSAVFSGGQNGLFRGGKIRITAGDKADVSLAVLECLLELIHGDPPLCSGRWPRSPCHHGRRR